MGNSWHFHRHLKAIAASCLLASAFAWVANAQSQSSISEETAAPPTNGPQNISLADIRGSFMQVEDGVVLRWRFVSDGKPTKIDPARVTPEFKLTGLMPISANLIEFEKLGQSVHGVALLSGQDRADVEAYAETGGGLIAAIQGKAGNFVFASAAPEYSVLSRAPLGTSKQALEQVLQEAVTKATFGKANQVALGAAYLELEQLLEGKAFTERGVLVVPANAFPSGAGELDGLAGAAFQRQMIIFPIVPLRGLSKARRAELQNLAGATGGRLVPLGAKPEQLAASLYDATGGGIVRYTFPAGSHYRLPGEADGPVAITLGLGNVEQTLILRDETPLISVAQLGRAVVDPREWGRWLTSGERWYYGLGVLVIWLLVLWRLIRLVFPTIKARILVTDSGASYKLRRLPVTIGRHEGGADIQIDQEGVSRKHAKLQKSGGHTVLLDLGSTNGTWIGDRKIDAQPLGTSQTVSFGPVSALIQIPR